MNVTRLFFSLFLFVIMEIGNGLEFSALQEAIPGPGSAGLLNFQHTPSSFLTYENQPKMQPVERGVISPTGKSRSINRLALLQLG